MKIEIVGRQYFEKIKGTSLEKFHLKNFNIISINTPQYKPKAFREEFAPFSECFLSLQNLLILKFHDYYRQLPGVQLMTEEDAMNIKKFMERIDRRKLLMIHCTAGISRSRTIGLCLSLYYNVIRKDGNKQDYFDYLKIYRPDMRVNIHVKNMMYKVFGLDDLKVEQELGEQS